MVSKEVIVTILARGGTTADWAEVNPTPKNREFCVEETTDGKRKFKIGDGVTAWSDLPYATSDELADLAQDATHRTVTDAEKAAWNAAAEKEIPTKTSDLTNDGENGTDKFATESYVNQKTSQIYRYKGSVATYNDLPTTHDVGDVYNVVAAYGDYPAGTNFAWNGTEWDALGGSIDTSAFVEESELATIAKSGKLSDATEDATHRVVTDTEKATWNAKQDALTFDTTPTANSSNPVTSGGVKTALDAKAAKSEIVKTSTGLTDSADLMRYTDTLTISGGGVS